MSYENRDPLPVDPNAGSRRPMSSERWGEWEVDNEDDKDDEDTQPRRAISVPSATSKPGSEQKDIPQPRQEQDQFVNSQFTHREHVTGALPVYSSEAPLFRPGASPPYPPQVPQQGAGYSPPQQWQGYPPQGAPQGIPPYQQQGYAYPAYQGYAPPYQPYGVYPGYNGYAPYAWPAPRPKQDGYRLAVIIISIVGSVLAILGGLGSILLLFIIGSAASLNGHLITGAQYFSTLLTLIAFAIAGVVGGGFSLYHSIRGILNKRSASFKLPWFWIFLILYGFVLGTGFALQAHGQEVASPALISFLIILAAIFPALALLALAVRRLHRREWTTTWRRFTLALTSGATLGIGLALSLELALVFLVVRGTNATNALQCIENPNSPDCGTFAAFDLIFIIVAIIGPLVEETVKPLGVALYIGRIRGPAEAFLLGMASGIGFALVETVGYIGSGYHDWLAVAIERTGAGLLHGVGAGMVALGWYYLTHAKNHRFLKAFGCWFYAVLQHFVWNGTAVLGLLPGPVGATINSWNLNLGFITLPFVELLNIIEAILILLVFFYITGRLRKKSPSSPPDEDSKRLPARQAPMPVRA